MNSQTGSIEVRVDLANPGQYFACCGLLELTHRLGHESEGWFDSGTFFLRSAAGGPDLLKALSKCSINNTMTQVQKKRREELGAMGQKAIKANPDLTEEKKTLDSLWRELPVVFGEPFGLQIDWFLDERSGGNSFKTWAGQQSIVDIVSDLRQLMPPSNSDSATWLETTSSACVPLNFDSNLGGAGADVDIGFSFDPLKISGFRIAMRPAIELLAFVGLQRFRPAEFSRTWEYGIWNRPAGVELGALTACGGVSRLASKRYRFQLLYRTKYLKSFLPGRPV